MKYGGGCTAEHGVPNDMVGDCVSWTAEERGEKNESENDCCSVSSKDTNRT